MVGMTPYEALVNNRMAICTVCPRDLSCLGLPLEADHLRHG